MRVLTIVAAAGNLIALVAVAVATSSMSRSEWNRVFLWYWLLIAVLLVNLIVSLWAALYADTGRFGRLFSLWLSAKEEELRSRNESKKP